MRTATGVLSCLVLGCWLLLGCWTAPSPVAPQARGSVGVPHDGVLTDAVALEPRGEGYVRFRRDGIRWGNPRLVQAIERAAERVATERPGSPPLVVGDLSARHGGRIARHRSHRTGRDADFLFYALTPDGRPVKNPGFYHFGPDGLAEVDGEYLQLDVDRTWLLVRSLVANEEAQVQWLFVARWIEAILIEHAMARGEPDELVAHAVKVLHQPSNASAHDDHFHVRIACTAEEAVQGCRGGGYQWPWLEQPPRSPGLSDEALMAAMFEDP